MRVFPSRYIGVAAYLTFVAGLGALCLNLSTKIGTQAMALASPYLVAKGERPITLVERRRLDAAVVAEADPKADAAFIPDAPSIPLGLLAAGMDVSEAADLAKAIPAVRRVARSRATDTRSARVAAADVFGRSFGVMLMASR